MEETVIEEKPKPKEKMIQTEIRGRDNLPIVACERTLIMAAQEYSYV